MSNSNPITCTYIDTRSFKLPNADSPLPLLTTLSAETQASITRFHRAPDRLMSLSSALLKHHFIHKTAKIPWSEVIVARSPKPHSRPYWLVPDSWAGEWEGGLEFNVSHQAGLTCLVGCKTTKRTVDLAPIDVSSLFVNITQLPEESAAKSPISPRLGVDVACTNEPQRGPRNITTPAKLAAWIDIFSEMFSAREREEMKLSLLTTLPEYGPNTRGPEIESKLRRFYTTWALKESFIKLVGEGLLASWLRELEFLDVQPPAPIRASSTQSWHEETKWTPPSYATRDFRVMLRGNQIRQEKIRMDVVAFEEDFVVAVARMCIEESEEESSMRRWLKLEIERDIKPCAEGSCMCLR